MSTSTEYSPDCTTDSRVYVNDHRLPAANVDIHMRKEGPLDITRYAEGTFASPFRGIEHHNYFESLSNTEITNYAGPDILHIDVLDYETNEYAPAFRGIVTGVGNTSGSDDNPTPSDREWHFRSQGPAHFLSKIPASKRFGGSTNAVEITDILQYVTEEFRERVPYTVEIERTVTDEDTDTTVTPLGNVTGGYQVSTQKSFTANKHTLADVVGWATDKTGLHLWIEPTDTGVLFVVTDEPTQRTHEAHYLGGDLRVVNNDALSELRPVNTQIVNGQAKKSLGSVGDFEINTPSNTFTQAKARHTPLYKRAGETELHADTVTKSDAESKIEVENEARKILKRKIDETTMGDMQALLRGPIRPYDTVEAKPTCDENTITETNPITYEVSRVHHQIRPAGISQTKLNVGVHAAMADIEVVGSWEKDA